MWLADVIVREAFGEEAAVPLGWIMDINYYTTLTLGCKRFIASFIAGAPRHDWSEGICIKGLLMYILT